MKFNRQTLAVGGRLRVPDSHVNTIDYATIREMTDNGVYVIWNEGTDKAQKSYLSYGWLNWRYGDSDKDDLNQDIPNLC